MGGGLLGVFVGVPIPIVGSIFGALLFACLGALIGAMFGEMSTGKGLNASWQIGKAAFGGRLAGTLGKVFLGSAMVLVVIVALVF
jgi:uncharacterized protein